MDKYYTMKDNNYLKFPSVIRDKLCNGEFAFPAHTQFAYDPILAYRGIRRDEDDFTAVSRKDFESHAERKIRRRGINQKDPHYFGVSLFLHKESLENALNLPRPNKKIAVGNVYAEAGPAEVNESTGHVCWWLYDKVDINGFSICER
ncbi:hypothetical protein [Bacteroides congonensis]|uniref:hypothetical protein n=1 Tax=Bacteroides congonensis TaxID=1871006 RepID=UPI00321B7B0D